MWLWIIVGIIVSLIAAGWFLMWLGGRGLRKMDLEPPYSISMAQSPSNIRELDALKQSLHRDVDEEMKNLEVFYTIVQCLNEGLEDHRLDTKCGTVEAVYELTKFNRLKGKGAMGFINNKAEDGFFEV